MTTVQPSWVAVDWGTSRLRAWLYGPDDALIAALSSDQGMGALDANGFEAALLDLIGDHLGDEPIPVLCCGMVGARQGWIEAPYVAVPCAAPGAAQAVAVAARDSRIVPRILPGIKQTAPADVMRGEETQIAGFLAEKPGFDGVICLPGTHTKWVHVSAGEIVSFRTFMTGELFALLSGQSVLRHGLTGDGWDDDAFSDAVSDAISAPQMQTARLFGLRAKGLISGLSADTARARLSGMLIGLELAGARHYWLGQHVALVGDPKLMSLYERALGLQGIEPEKAEGDAMVRAGLLAAHSQIREDIS